MSTKIGMGLGKLPSSVLTRPQVLLSCSSSSSSSATSTSPSAPRISTTQVRHATFVPRPRRPYTFTQLVQLSDGSCYTVRTTSPQGLLKSDKDSRNHIIWQPSDKSLRNVEVDEAGKLAAFRERFGRGWDLESKPVEGQAASAAPVATPAETTTDKDAVKAKGGEKQQPEQKKQAAAAPVEEEEDAFDSLTDLISSYATVDNNTKGGRTAKEQEKLDKKK
ncbi:hypothetical protein V8F20_006682 [Naviculisporaceae sp. PSN 640]